VKKNVFACPDGVTCEGEIIEKQDGTFFDSTRTAHGYGRPLQIKASLRRFRQRWDWLQANQARGGIGAPTHG